MAIDTMTKEQLLRSINVHESLKMLARKCDKYAQFVQAFARKREGKASVLVNPEKAYKFQAEYMPLLEQICGSRLGENPNDPTHPLYRWKA